jgi:ABC-type transport system involved in cytochrome c biogenesis permease subunit
MIKTVILTAAFVTGLLATTSTAAEGAPTAPSPRQWPADIVALCKTLPIQDGGRVKPLDTYAGFKMLKLHGKRTMRLSRNGERIKLTPVEWLLDTLFYPELAVDYPTFNVDNSDVIVAIGVTPHKKKRDRYSYTELQPGIERLYALAREWNAIEAKDRTPMQAMTVNLATNINEFEYLLHYVDFARHTVQLPLQASESDSPVPTTEAMVILLKMRRYLGTAKPGILSWPPVIDALIPIYGFSETANAIAIFPPSESEDLTWRTAGNLIARAFASEDPRQDELELLAALEQLVAARADDDAFHGHLTALHTRITGRAQARGEYGKIRLEVFFYKSQFFYRSLCLFLLGFLCIALSWLSIGDRGIGRLLNRAAPVLVVLPLLVLCAGITIRCIIRSRPPVSTLYETVLFITAVIVFVALVIEYANRQRIALALASVLGVCGMFLANKYELKEAVDTMPSLVAVLDTNFWLSTHVTTVTIGYAAGLLAAAIAHVYLLGRLFKFRNDDDAFYRNLTRMVYGVVCFGLLFSFTGTVLGGIWANDSWGRFWGWDPKENGALMIVLWNLTILHARMGGFIRDLGIHACAVFGGMIVAFSWWGVNLLGIGLHSYGFTSGIMKTLTIFWSIEAALLFVACKLWLRSKRAARKAPLSDSPADRTPLANPPSDPA